MPRRPQGQIGFNDEWIKDEALEAKLMSRAGARVALERPLGDYRLADRAVKDAIAELNLEPGEYRCGGFLITIGATESRQVQFERRSSTTVSIRPAVADDEGDE